MTTSLDGLAGPDIALLSMILDIGTISGTSFFVGCGIIWVCHKTACPRHLGVYHLPKGKQALLVYLIFHRSKFPSSFLLTHFVR
jgi:hypothetical protein